MGEAFITRRGKMPEDYTTIEFNNVLCLTKETPPALSASKMRLAAVSTSNYAFFAGGSSWTTFYNTVDVFDANLTKSTASTLSGKKRDLAGTAVGDYAIFGGGENSGTSGLVYVDAYNTETLAKTTATTFSWPRASMAAASIGDYAIFFRGVNASSIAYTDTEIYDATLSHTVGTRTAYDSQAYLAAGTIANYAFFAGGMHSPNSASSTATYYYSSVIAYNASLTRTVLANVLSNARAYLSAATIEDQYILFAGGSNASGNCTEIDVYNNSLTRVTTISLPTATQDMVGISLGKFAIFAGGLAGTNNTTQSTAYIIDSSLTIVATFNLSYARVKAAAATIGDYAIIAGGYSNVSGTTLISVNEALKLIDSMPIFKGVKYKLGSMSSELTASSTISYPIDSITLSGYVKTPNSIS